MNHTATLLPSLGTGSSANIISIELVVKGKTLKMERAKSESLVSGNLDLYVEDIYIYCINYIHNQNIKALQEFALYSLFYMKVTSHESLE